jgi:hypothetical protein
MKGSKQFIRLKEDDWEFVGDMARAGNSSLDVTLPQGMAQLNKILNSQDHVRPRGE